MAMVRQLHSLEHYTGQHPRNYLKYIYKHFTFHKYIDYMYIEYFRITILGN